jgi:ATP-grasp domain
VGQNNSNLAVGQGGGLRVLLTNTDRWPGPARLAISLSRVGCEVSALCPIPGHPMSKTRAVRQVLPYEGYCQLRSLKNAIEVCDPQIVIPCDDLAVQHLHELYVQAGETSDTDVAHLLERSLGSPASYPVVSSRYDLLKTAGEEGILVPDTTLIRSMEDLKSWQGKCEFPFVLKADGTWGGRGVRIVQNAAQAEQAYLELSTLPVVGKVIQRLLLDRDWSWLRSWWQDTPPVITAQSYIAGRPANCAVVCWEGEVLAGIAVEVVSAQELTGPATVVRVVDSPDMLGAAKRIGSRLGISGFFGLDFMIDDSHDAIYLVEMNPRCTPLCHLQLGKGQDMVGALWASLAGQTYEAAPAVTQNDMIAYYPQALRAQSEFLQSSFHDVPQDEPQLIEELLHPWCGRSLLGRVIDSVRPAAIRRRSSEPCLFEAAVSHRSIS